MSPGTYTALMEQEVFNLFNQKSVTVPRVEPDVSKPTHLHPFSLISI